MRGALGAADKWRGRQAGTQTHVYAPSRESVEVQLFRVLYLKRLRVFQGTLPVRHREVVRRIPNEVNARPLPRLNKDLRRTEKGSKGDEREQRQRTGKSQKEEGVRFLGPGTLGGSCMI